MKIHLLRLKGVKRVTELELEHKEKASSIRETGKNSITSGTTVPEVWIMSGLLLSVVMQIVSASHLPKLGDQPEDE